MISKHLSLEEVTRSNTAKSRGIDNTPNDEQLANLKIVAEKIFEPLRRHLNIPIGISSGFRSKELNEALRGSKTSDHMKGFALDIDADIHGGVTNYEIFMYIYNRLEFSQLIWEKGDDNEPNWIHVSFNPDNLKNEVLKYKNGKYKQFHP